MARRQSASSARAKRPARSAKHILDNKIDFSDIPESTDEELVRATRVGKLAATRPAVINDDAELERVTEEVNGLVTKGIKPDGLAPEEERLLALLTRLIEDYEQQHHSL
jgi:hypothetical protein